MKKIFVLLFCVALSFSVNAQEMANIGKAISVVSPEIHGTTVTFRLEAPLAERVQVNGNMTEEIAFQGGSGRQCVPVDMVKNSEGIWEYTCECEPNLYNYIFIVDGLCMCDPANPYRQRDGYEWFSTFIVDGKYSENYREANQRGNLHEIWYDAPSCGKNKRMIVYTPYGYEDNPDKSYPVLYLMAGGMRDEEQWSEFGLVRQILDNNIEKGKAVPMIVVMPNYRSKYSAAEYIEIPGYRFERDNIARGDGDEFPKELAEDIIPYIDSHFRTIADRDHRAIGGFSMGSIISSNFFLQYPELISNLYVIPGSGRESEQSIAQWTKVKKLGYKTIYVASGVDDFGYRGTVAMHNLLKKLHIKHKYSETPGGHAFYNARHHLNQFVPMIFKGK